jgi:transposase
MAHVIEGLTEDWRRLDQRITELSNEIEDLAKRDPACVRLMSVPGIGPIISSAMVAAIGTGDGFSKGRDFAAWLGLVPQADFHGRSHHPRQHIQAWQSLSARPIRAGSLGHAREGESEQMGGPWAQAVDRSRQEATAPQRACDCACQQACTYRLERTGSWSRLRGEQATSGVIIRK